jgi:hypothetical protein
VLPGGDGVGKSTSAVACAEAGLAVMADDVVAIELGARTAHTLYTSLKLRVPPVSPSGVEQHLDADGGRVWDNSQRDAGGALPPASAPIAAIGLPRLSDASESEPAPVGVAEAVRTLLVADQMRDGRLAQALDDWSALVEAVPVAQLRIGRDRSTIPPAIRSLRAAVA